MKRSQVRFGPMTSMRFIAAIHVVILHESLDVIPGASAWVNTMLGRTAAVSLFFFVSGFVLSYSYIDRAFDRLTTSTFIVNRLARVYPLYVAGLLAWVPIYVLRFTIGQDEPVWMAVRTFFVNLFLLQSWVPARGWYMNIPGWTVSTFAFFWITLPFFLPWLRRLRGRWLLAAFGFFWLLSQALVWWFETYYGLGGERIHVLYKHPLVRWPEFLMGVALGVWFARGLGHIRIWHVRSVFPAAGALAVAAFLFLPSGFDNYLHNGLLMPLLAVVLVSSMVTDVGHGYGLDASWLVRQGKSSFSLYIIHLPFANYLGKVFNFFLGETMRFTPMFVVVDVALLMLLAPWIERVFETPVRQRIKSWWMRRVGPMDPVPS